LRTNLLLAYSVIRERIAFAVTKISQRVGIPDALGILAIFLF